MKTWIYKHYKNKDYEVLGVVKHSETLEDLVLYKALYDSEEFWKNTLWVRPKSMFFEDIVINNEKVPRFKYVWEK